MAKLLSLTARTSLLNTVQKPASARRSRVVKVRAEEGSGPRLSFKPNTRSAAGYTDDDSAGQTNIFAIEAKTYVQGSSADQEYSKDSNQGGATIGLIAAGLVALIGAGSLFVSLKAPDTLETTKQETEKYEPISFYAAQFAAETRAPAE